MIRDSPLSRLTDGMRYWKENSVLIALTALIPFLVLYVDRPVIRWLRGDFKGSPLYHLVERVEPIVSFMSDGLVLTGLALALFLLGRYRRNSLERSGLLLLWSLVASSLLVHIPKHLFGRGRPNHDTGFLGPTFKGGYESFPSGHAATAFSFAFVMSHFYPRYRLLFYGFAIVVGLERIEDVHHFPADVVGGAVFGIVVAKVVLRLLGRSTKETVS